jgi:myo-inositol 2-dehydrogenase / D-chiro-inositol 1-dehydrogenase
MNLRICMIGCGGFARLCHGPSQRRIAAANPGLQLAACCDTDATRAKEYAEAFGFARHYTDSFAMLSAEQPDAVVMAVPPAFTCRAASAVLELGFPLLLEKPPGISLAELEQLIAAAAPVQVAFNRRYMPVMKKAREILDAHFPPASVSRIDYAMIRFDRWDADFSTTAVHAIDAAISLARSPFVAVDLRYQKQMQGDRESVNVVINAECASGCRVSIIIQPVAGRNAEWANVHAVGQSLMINIPASPLSGDVASLDHWRGNTVVASYADDARDVGERFGILGETEAFLEAVRADAGVHPNLLECRQQVALMEAIRLRQPGPAHLAPTRP